MPILTVAKIRKALSNPNLDPDAPVMIGFVDEAGPWLMPAGSFNLAFDARHTNCPIASTCFVLWDADRPPWIPPGPSVSAQS